MNKCCLTRNTRIAFRSFSGIGARCCFCQQTIFDQWRRPDSASEDTSADFGIASRVFLRATAPDVRLLQDLQDRLASHCAAREHSSDLADCIGRIQIFRADVCAVQNDAATKESVRIFELVQSRFRGHIARIDVDIEQPHRRRTTAARVVTAGCKRCSTMSRRARRSGQKRPSRH
jgi:hypothetical protein